MRKPKMPKVVNDLHERKRPVQGRRIVAIDFDGTLVNNNYPFIENPNLELIRALKRYDDKYIYILWTCRVGEQLQQAVDYMHKTFGFDFDYVNRNASEIVEKFGCDCRKVFANIYLDDRGVRDFNGIIF